MQPFKLEYQLFGGNFCKIDFWDKEISKLLNTLKVWVVGWDW